MGIAVFATSMYDAHAILMRGKVIERCRENLANIHGGRHVWRYCGLCRGLGAAACVQRNSVKYKLSEYTMLG